MDYKSKLKTRGKNPAARHQRQGSFGWCCRFYLLAKPCEPLLLAWHLSSFESCKSWSHAGLEFSEFLTVRESFLSLGLSVNLSLSLFSRRKRMSLFFSLTHSHSHSLSQSLSLSLYQ